MSKVGRVAIPLESVTPRPTLVPQDIWLSYQRELESEGGGDEPELLDDSEFDEVPSEVEFGSFTATITADLEVALLSLSQVDLFEGLKRPALERLAKSARQGEVSAGEFMFFEGQPADCFYVVLDGSVEMLRRRDGREITLRQMERGEAIGLFGLLSGQTRAASARAVGEALILEVPCAALNELIAEDATLRDRVVQFYERRLLESFLAGSKLFSELDAPARTRLQARFTRRRVRAGEALLAPGEVGNLFAVLVTGKLMLELPSKAGADRKAFVLDGAQFVAVTSALSGAPCRMRVYASEECSLLWLGHRELSELVRDLPALRALLQRLPQSARALDRDVYCGHTGVTGL
jgi:CRP/FNR family transcriptional regulator, cyclic AMP receptor protein